MSGKLNNYRGSGANALNTLSTWSCQLHDATTSLSGYGTVLVLQNIDALGNSTKTWTDSAGRTLRSIDQLDKVTAVTYDAGGNQLTVRDPNNVGADMVYDSLGRNTQRTDTFGDVTKTDYDKAGNAVKQTDAKNKYTLISFDSRNRRKSTTDRISAPTTFTYLATGQLASLTDAESQTTAYTYDARGSKLTEQYPDHSSGSTVGQPGYGIVTFVYDNAGRVLRKQDQLGDTCTYNFDLAGRMTSRNYRSAANSPSGTIADTDTFTFDRSGRMMSAVSGRYTNTVGYAYDPVGRKASESLTIASQTYSVGSEFNARNELVKYTYPDSSIANRAYNARGGLSELKLDGSVIDSRSYDDGGRMTSEVLSNGITETRAYRTDNLLSSISFSNTNIGNLGYSWDANKNKTAETIGGVMSGYGFTSAGTAYDDEDRLTGYQRAATSGSALLAQSWALTSVGDWSSVTTNGTAVTRTHGPTHELLTSGGQSVTTDVKGNQTVLPASLASQAAQLAFTWDYDNKLKSSDIDNNGSADVAFEYDALGRRVARTEGSNAMVYFQADQQTIADYPRGGAASTATYRYVFASYIDEPVVRKTTGSSGTVLFFHRNQQYSIYALTDSSGAVSGRYAYTAYGQPTFLNASATVQTSSAASNRYTYTAREWDATLGLHHFRARWMSGLTGRFLTRDPIGTRLLLPFYEYGSSKPITKVDPLGLLDGGVDGDVNTISCEQFLQTVPTLDPDDWLSPNRARNAFNRGPHIFCGDCDKFQNYSFKGKDGNCHVCLGNTDKSNPNGGPLESYLQQWVANLVHELVHCDQYKCGGKQGTPPSLGNPISPTDPDWIPPEHTEPNAPNCAKCQLQELHAYNEQCRVLFREDNKKRKECVEAGKCYSCAYVCGTKQSDCPKFPVYVPQGK